ncbi:hypothetical protein SCHPADRAFT_997608 [Schizopora paradoxa]|uniref:Uncharacterized protein n=1 Tax=Schizopora paradoxa TaxID=27342 RepID=A0A0H2RMH6_9AGAM|nr:hypothetical protein SCHPADRAFT_997608 [Schizopora paradoxa]
MYGMLNDNKYGAGWKNGPTCSSCLARLDSSQVFNRTWHGTSTGENAFNVSYASITFTEFSVQIQGVAIYVMGVIVSNTPATNTSLNNSRIFFQVDNIDQGSFLHTASLGSITTYSYNTTLFAKEGLSNGVHSVTMLCGDGSHIDSLCLFDRFVYTTQVDSSSNSVSSSDVSQPTDNPVEALGSHSRISVGVIVAVTLASTLSVVILVGLYFLRRRHNRKRNPTVEQDVQVQSVFPIAISYANSSYNEHSTDLVSTAGHGLPSYSDIADINGRPESPRHLRAPGSKFAATLRWPASYCYGGAFRE